jgi:hypothetical protein
VSLRSWWHRKQRSTDLEILWPACRDQAPNIEQARAAFYFHTVNDRAWTEHYNEEELHAYVWRLS